MQKEITYEQYREAMEMLEFHERKVEQLKRITRGYVYQVEADRVKDRKIQAVKDNLNQQMQSS